MGGTPKSQPFDENTWWYIYTYQVEKMMVSFGMGGAPKSQPYKKTDDISIYSHFPQY